MKRSTDAKVQIMSTIKALLFAGHHGGAAITLSLAIAVGGAAGARPITPDEDGFPALGAASQASPYADILARRETDLAAFLDDDFGDGIRSPAWPVIFEDGFSPSRIATTSRTYSPWLADSGSLAEWRRLEGLHQPPLDNLARRSGTNRRESIEAAPSNTAFALGVIADIENPAIQSLVTRVIQPSVDAHGTLKLSVPGIWKPAAKPPVKTEPAGPRSGRLAVIGGRGGGSARQPGASPSQFGNAADFPVRRALVLVVRILNFITDPVVVALAFAFAFGIAALRIAQRIGTIKRHRRHRYQLDRGQGEKARPPRTEDSHKHSRSSRRRRFHLHARRSRASSSVGAKPG